MNTKGQDYILDHTGATEWKMIVDTFGGMNTREIENELDEIFHTENNNFLALAIEAELSK